MSSTTTPPSSSTMPWQAFAAAGLGLENDGKIRLAPHDEAWRKVYATEAYRLCHGVNGAGLKLFHVGSTAVPDCMAKPIIDIVASVATSADLDPVGRKVEALGYTARGEFGIPGRRFFELRDDQQNRSFCHLHLFAEGHPAVNEHLKFRDSLRVDDASRLAYGQLKQSLDLPRGDYTAGKASFIQGVVKDGKPFYAPRDRPKVLGLLGASRGHGNTMRFLEESYGQQDFQLIDLESLDIEPFRYGSAAREDEFLTVVKAMLAVDEIVFATPVYWYAMSGVMKDVMDRLTDLLSADLKAYGKQLYGKRARLLATGSDDELPRGFEVPFQLTCTYFGMDYMGAAYRSCK